MAEITIEYQGESVLEQLTVNNFNDLQSYYGKITTMMICNTEMDEIEDIDKYLYFLNRDSKLILHNVMINSIDCSRLRVLNLSDCFVGLVIRGDCVINRRGVVKIVLSCQDDYEYLINRTMLHPTIIPRTGKIETDEFKFRGFIDANNIPVEGILIYKKTERLLSNENKKHDEFKLKELIDSVVLPLIYYGSLKNYMKIGFGVLIYSNGTCYRGYFDNDKRNRYGEIITNDIEDPTEAKNKSMMYLWENDMCIGKIEKTNNSCMV
jgi:hypothetical protein